MATKLLAKAKRPALRRLPRAMSISASSLPQSVGTQSLGTSILMPTDASTQLLATPPPVAPVTPAMQRRANQLAKQQQNRLKKLNKYNATLTGQAANLATGIDKPIDFTNVAANTSTVLDPIDWSVTGGNPSGIAPSSGITDASRLLAPNMPNLPNIGPADIRRERQKNKELQQSINKINRFNKLRNKQAASLALGLDSPVDYSNVLPGGQADPNAVLQNPDPYAQQAQQPYPLYPGAPTPGYPPQYPQAGGGYPQMPQGMYPSPGYEPYTPPMASMSPLPPLGGMMDGPIFSSQIAGETYSTGAFVDPMLAQYNPDGYMDQYMPELAWQDTAPFSLPNMTADGDLLFMEPNESGERTMNEAFGEYFDAEPLDSYAAFADAPAQTNFWSGLTQLAKGGTDAYNSTQTAKTNAQAQLLAQQNAARAAAAKKQPAITTPMIVIGVAALGLIAFAATRRGK